MRLVCIHRSICLLPHANQCPRLVVIKSTIFRSWWQYNLPYGDYNIKPSEEAARSSLEEKAMTIKQELPGYEELSESEVRKINYKVDR